MIYIKNKRTYKGPGVYIGRPSPLGNPFTLEFENDRVNVINKYRAWLNEHKDDIKVRAELTRLLRILDETGELTLICWCYPKKCHGEVIADLLGSIKAN